MYFVGFGNKHNKIRIVLDLRNSTYWKQWLINIEIIQQHVHDPNENGRYDYIFLLFDVSLKYFTKIFKNLRVLSDGQFLIDYVDGKTFLWGLFSLNHLEKF